MNIRNVLAPLLIGALAQALTAKAGDLYLVNLHGTCKTINQVDRLALRPINNASILRSCAPGLTDGTVNMRDLRLVYDIDADKISVYNIATGETLCDFVTFGEPSLASNLHDTVHVRHVYLFHPSLPGGIGSLVLNEQIGRNADNVPVRYTATGNFHYLIRASQTSAPQMCTGTLSIGGRLGLPGAAGGR